MDKTLFKAKVLLSGMNVESLAEAIGLSTGTLYRKINGLSDFTRNEIVLIRDNLKLTNEDIDAIFFAE